MHGGLGRNGGADRKESPTLMEGSEGGKNKYEPHQQAQKNQPYAVRVIDSTSLLSTLECDRESNSQKFRGGAAVDTERIVDGCHRRFPGK
jgi:hypothetical protein